MTTTTTPAYELVGHEGIFRLPGGRSTYSDVIVKDGGDAIRLARLEPRTTPEGEHYLHQVDRYIAWDQPVEVLKDHTAEYEAAQEAEYQRCMEEG